MRKISTLVDSVIVCNRFIVPKVVQPVKILLVTKFALSDTFLLIVKDDGIRLESGGDLKGMTGFQATERFPNISSRPLIEISINPLFITFLLTNFQKVAKKIQWLLRNIKIMKMTRFLHKSEPLFKIFTAFVAENWTTYQFWSPPFVRSPPQSPPDWDAT